MTLSSNMKYRRVFFIRVSLALIVTTFSLSSHAGVITYNFDYLKLPVAKLSIDFNEEEYTKSDIFFSIETKGPLAIYREYFSEGHLKYQHDGSWFYSISGSDRGQPEDKLIIFSMTREPVIKKFIDDEGVSPISISKEQDRGAIDPFSVIVRTISNLEKGKNCHGDFLVIDGKRRYKVNMKNIGSSLPIIDKNLATGKISHCRLAVLNSENKSNKYRIWPFSKQNIFIDLWFSHEKKYLPIRIRVKTPIGSIIGRATI